MTAFDVLSRRGQVERLRQLAFEALSSYDIRAERVTPLPRGDNSSFCIDTAEGPRYVLRIHRVSGTPWHPVRGVAEVSSEQTWLAAIRRDTDLVVPEPVPNRDGDLLTIAAAPGIPEPRLCVLSHWVDGRFFNAGLTPAHMRRVGAFMARLHEHAEGFHRPAEFSRGRVGDLPPEVEIYVLDTLAADRGTEAVSIAHNVIERARAVQQDLGEDPNVFGLIHGDLHQENYLFHHGAVRAIDFDDCGFGLWHWDFAVTLSEICYKPEYPALKSALFSGYESIRLLPPDLERSVATLTALRHLQLVMWFLEMRYDPAFSNWEHEVDGLLRELKEDFGA